MRLDDRFMTMLTALVLIIAIGALVHGSGDGSSLFGGGKTYVAEADSFHHRAGKVQNLDVLLNDRNVDAIDPLSLQIAASAPCGYALPLGGEIQFSDSVGCTGVVQFAYCVPSNGRCEPTTVTLTIVNVNEELERMVQQDMVQLIVAPDTPGAGEADGGATAIARNDVAPVRPAATPQRVETQADTDAGTVDIVLPQRNARPVVAATNDGATPDGFGSGSSTETSGIASLGGVANGPQRQQPTAPIVTLAEVTAPEDRPSLPRVAVQPAPPLPSTDVAAVTVKRPAVSTGPSLRKPDSGVAPTVVTPSNDIPVVAIQMGGSTGPSLGAPQTSSPDSQPDLPVVARPEPPVRPRGFGEQVIASIPATAPTRPSLSVPTAPSAPATTASPGLRTPTTTESAPTMPATGQQIAARPVAVVPEAMPVGIADASRLTAPDAQINLGAQARIEAPVERSGMQGLLARTESIIGKTASAALLARPDADQNAAGVNIDATITARPSAVKVEQASILSSFDTATLSGSAVRLPDRVGALPGIATSRSTLRTASLGTARAATDIFVRKTATAPTIVSIARDPAMALQPGTGRAQQPAGNAVNEFLASLPPIDEDQPNPFNDRNQDSSCNIRVDLSTKAGAEIVGSVTSPCRPNTRFEIEHAGLSFSVVTNERGAQSFVLPALTERAQVTATAADGASASSTARVSEVDRFMRIAIAWEGTANLDLHALEFGAIEGEKGHVWEGNQSSYRQARRAGGGFLRVLGQDNGSPADGAKVEVYTVPRTSRTGSGLIELNVSIANPGGDCGNALNVRTVRAIGSNVSSEPDVSIGLSPCGSQEITMLRNVVRDLRIARN